MNGALIACDCSLASCLLRKINKQIKVLLVSCKKFICRARFSFLKKQKNQKNLAGFSRVRARFPAHELRVWVSPEVISQPTSKGPSMFWLKYMSAPAPGAPRATLPFRGQVLALGQCWGSRGWVSMTTCLHFSQLVIPQCNKTVWSLCLAPVRATFSHKNAQYPPQPECKSPHISWLAVTHAANIKKPIC